MFADPKNSEIFMNMINDNHVSEIIITEGSCITVVKNRNIMKLKDYVLDKNDISAFKDKFYISALEKDISVENIQFRSHLAYCAEGERIFLRKHNNDYNWDNLNIPVELYDHIVNDRYGIILLAGPPDSGKTTTVDKLLNIRAEKGGEHIVTIEDPLEVSFPDDLNSLITQHVVDFDDEENYKAKAKSILRERPDVIFVSEIRCKNTAKTVLSAYHSGRLVIGTIHANDVCSIPESFILKLDESDREFGRQALADGMKIFTYQEIVSSSLTPLNSIALFTILMPTSAVKTAIMNKSQGTKRIKNHFSLGISYGHQDFELSIKKAYHGGYLSNEDVEEAKFKLL